MTEHLVTPLLRAAKIVLLALGGLVAYLAWKGYRRSRETTMLYLSAGFALITVGILLQGVLFELADVALARADLAATLVSLAGFGVIVWSLYR